MIRPPVRRVVPSDRAAIPDEWCRDQLTESGEPIELRLSTMNRFATDAESRLRLSSQSFARKRGPAALPPADLRLPVRLSVAALDPPEGGSLTSSGIRSALGAVGLLAFENRRGLVIYSMTEIVTFPAAISPSRSDVIHQSVRRSLRASFHRE
jgi:hypothetical protein